MRHRIEPLLLVAGTLVATPFAHAYRTRPECALRETAPERIISTASSSGSYQQPMAAGRYVIQMAPNVAIDLQTGTETALTDGIDPYPTPDEQFIVHPNPLRFYRFEDVLKQGSATLPSYTDYAHEGYYQSVGMPDRSAQQATYRVLTGQGAGTIRDYRVSFDARGAPTQFTPVQPAPVPLCPKLRSELDFSLPIISKDGSEFATLNERTGTTQVFRIDPTTGECTLADDLGIRTAKVNFSFGGKQLAFHAAPLDLGPIGKSPRTSYQTQAFVYDRLTRTITQLTDSGTSLSGSQYPGFTRDGHVVLQRTEDKHWSYTRSYVVMDPSRTTSMPGPNARETAIPACFRSLDEYYGALSALGKLWREACLAGEFSYASDEKIALGLTRDGCRTLVNRHYDSKFIQKLTSESSKPAETMALLAELSPGRLMAACPSRDPGEPKPSKPAIIARSGSFPAKAPAVIQEKCVACHQPGSPHGYIPFENLGQLDALAPFKPTSTEPSLRKEIVRRIKAGAPGMMPVADPLSDAERTEIQMYLSP